MAPAPAPARSRCGTIGRKCVVSANHFLVELGQKDPYQYDVTIAPEVFDKTKRRKIMHMLSDLYRQSLLGNMLLAFDGNKSAFTAGPLPFFSKEFVVKLTESNGLEKEFKVKIKFASKKDICSLRHCLSRRRHDNSQETIQALDVVLREAASITGWQIVGRSLYSTDSGKGVLGGGIGYRKGFYQSLRPTQMGLSLNVDVSARAFYEPKLVTEFVADYLGGDLMRPLTDQELIKVKRALTGVKVEVIHGDYMRRYKVQALTVEPTSQLTFPVDATGATMSVVGYFKDKYNIDLKFPHLPAIQAGTDAKPTYLPMEICSIAGGQGYGLELNKKQVTKLVRATCRRPHGRENSILEAMRRNNYNSQEIVSKEFGMYVQEKATMIEARVLEAPLLKYGGSRAKSEVSPSVGRWEMGGQYMINAGTVTYWATANFSGYEKCDVGLLIDAFVSTCRYSGMKFEPKPLIGIYDCSPNNIERDLVDIDSRCRAQLKEVAGTSLQLLFVILPRAKAAEAKRAYSRIKRVCETKLGIVSQCCKPHYVMGCKMQYFQNISLKINLKVGGRNVVLARELPYLTDRPTIIFGADVTHPSPGEDSIPSIAAVVASMDWPQVTKYKASVSSQPRRQEIIEDLFSMMRELLISFKNSTPERIIFYRDGVSEGQFDQVLRREMKQIWMACASMEYGFMPRVTFILVQKRHHTRFFPQGDMEPRWRHKLHNILPGTVVDTKICHPTGFDFYLCSHAGYKGTSRPTHYHVLYDGNELSADGIQNLTNSLCYTYQRCTRSLSVVPPAYYAHLAACRARCYMEGELSDSASSDGGGTRESVPVIHDNVKNVMFYC